MFAHVHLEVTSLRRSVGAHTALVRFLPCMSTKVGVIIGLNSSLVWAVGTVEGDSSVLWLMLRDTVSVNISVSTVRWILSICVEIS